MRFPAAILLSSAVVLSGVRAADVHVLVSSTASARPYDPAVGDGYAVQPVPHADVNVTWHPGTETFSAGFRTDDEIGVPPVQFGPEDALAYLPPTGRRVRAESSGEQFDFQGPHGGTYWLFPSSASTSNNNQTLYLGFSAYGVPRDGTFVNDRIYWTVHAVENLTTPAANAFYGYSVAAGTVNMQLTLDPAYPGSEMVMLGEGHTHLNLIFRAPGMYRVWFTVRGTLAATGEEVSGEPMPVYFGIEQWEIPGAFLTYASWKDGVFTEAQAADPAISGPSADPDGDGFDNLEEYAFGGDPLVADAAVIRPRLRRAGGGWEFLVRQRTDASDLVVLPEASASLDVATADWRTDWLVPGGDPVPVGDSVAEFAYQLTVPEDARAFLRVESRLMP